MAETGTQKKAQAVIEVSAKDLPLSCPPSAEGVAEMHPRVFLPIEKTGRAVCPYCGAVYELKD